VKIGDIFEGTRSDSGMWTIAYPDNQFRARPLFTTCDIWGQNLMRLQHTLTLTAAECSSADFTEAMMDCYLEGAWLIIQKNPSAYNSAVETQFRFETNSDAVMFKLFGFPGEIGVR
jgi:hypothetical protein